MVERVVAGMLDRGILFDEAGVLWLGVEGQETFGRRNFLDLVSVFTSPPVFTVLHGHAEVGSVDESTFLARREDGPPVLLLAGRAWRVVHLDWKRRRAHVEPAEEAGRSRWRGEGQFLGHALCRSIRGVLAGDDASPRWSRRATDRIADLRLDFPWLDRRDDNVLVSAGGVLTWWTFAGGRANAALAQELSRRLDARAGSDNLAVTLGRPPDPGAVAAVIADLRDLAPYVPGAGGQRGGRRGPEVRRLPAGRFGRGGRAGPADRRPGRRLGPRARGPARDRRCRRRVSLATGPGATTAGIEGRSWRHPCVRRPARYACAGPGSIGVLADRRPINPALPERERGDRWRR